MDLDFIGQLVKGIFYSSRNILLSLPTYIGIASFIFLVFPKLEGKMKDRLEGVRRHKVNILLGFLLLSTILTSYNLYENKQPNFATPEQLISNSLNGLTIRIADLARESDIVRGKSFTDCRLYGPAVILPSACIINDSGIFGDPNGVFVVTTNEVVMGVIMFDSCVITNCYFYDISFIGNADQTAELKEGVTIATNE